VEGVDVVAETGVDLEVRFERRRLVFGQV